MFLNFVNLTKAHSNRISRDFCKISYPLFHDYALSREITHHLPLTWVTLLVSALEQELLIYLQDFGFKRVFNLG